MSHSASSVCPELDLPEVILAGYQEEHSFRENPHAMAPCTTLTYYYWTLCLLQKSFIFYKKGTENCIVK